jgi:hypothetical protein
VKTDEVLDLHVERVGTPCRCKMCGGKGRVRTLYIKSFYAVTNKTTEQTYNVNLCSICVGKHIEIGLMPPKYNGGYCSATYKPSERDTLIPPGLVNSLIWRNEFRRTSD